MRIRNKHSGEYYYGITNIPQAKFSIRLFVTKQENGTTGQTYHYDSIAAMCRDWEDA